MSLGGAWGTGRWSVGHCSHFCTMRVNLIHQGTRGNQRTSRSSQGASWSSQGRGTSTSQQGVIWGGRGAS